VGYNRANLELVTMNVDLHCHTTQSDGTLSPAELIALATQRKIDMLAITDHDSIDCYSHIKPSDHNFTLIPGIELSTTWRNQGVHIVGLNIDLKNKAFIKGVNQQAQARDKRAIKIAKKLEDLGFENTLQGAKRCSGGSQVGRPHFARYLVQINAVNSVQQAFNKYLGSGKVGDIKEHWASLDEVISWIRGAGGIAVLAHPTKYKLTRTKLCSLLEDFIDAGGEGMEVISGSQTPATTNAMSGLCQKYQLLASCGSDFHSLNQSWASLGQIPQLPSRCVPVWSRWQ
jgi:predicted metal-dependent phosphoesterase TrpH